MAGAESVHSRAEDPEEKVVVARAGGRHRIWGFAVLYVQFVRTGTVVRIYACQSRLREFWKYRQNAHGAHLCSLWRGRDGRYDSRLCEE